MATVAISNIIEQVPWWDLMMEKMTASNAFLRSGVLETDPILAQKFSGSGARSVQSDFYGPLATSATPRYNNDTPAASDGLTHKNVSAKTAKAYMSYMNDSWSVMSFAKWLAAQDPVAAITSQLGDYWDLNSSTRLINTLLGVYADNVANDSGDMVKDISIDTTAEVTASNQINAEAILDAFQTLGDAKKLITAIAVPSAVHNQMQKQNLIDTVPNSEQNIGFGTYLQKTLIVDDALPTITGSNHNSYLCMLFGRGALGLVNQMPDKAFEVYRAPYSGNGGGEDIFYSRMNQCIHPYGFSFTENTITGDSPTNDDLKVAANWDRKVARKLIPLAFLKVNA